MQLFYFQRSISLANDLKRPISARTVAFNFHLVAIGYPAPMPGRNHGPETRILSGFYRFSASIYPESLTPRSLERFGSYLSNVGKTFHVSVPPLSRVVIRFDLRVKLNL